MDREYGYDIIRGLGMLMILWHHINTTITSMGLTPNFPLFLNNDGCLILGSIGVIIFFALSGALLARNYCYKENFAVLKFYKKRVVKILIPHMIAYVLMLGFCFVMNPQWILETPPIAIVSSFFALDYFGEPFFNHFGFYMLWIVGEWFTTVIIILYVIFPLLRWLFRKIPVISTIMITALFMVNLHFQILSFYGGGFSLTNALFAFWIGMLIDKYKDCFFKKYIIVPLISALLCLVMIIWNPATFVLSPYLLVAIFGILLFIVMLNLRIKSNLISYFANYSYDAYLIHHRLFFIFLPALLNPYMSMLQYFVISIFLIFVVFKLSEVFHKLCDFICKPLFRVKDKSVNK